MSNLGFKGYTMDKDGCYREPTIIQDQIDFSNFLINNVEIHHELRIVDKDDYIVFQVIDQVLVFPLPKFGSVANKWDHETKKFKSI